MTMRYGMAGPCFVRRSYFVTIFPASAKTARGLLVGILMVNVGACSVKLEHGRAKVRSRVIATGVTVCYDADGNYAPCGSASLRGQDGEYRAGLVRSYADNGDGTITDEATGLIWCKEPAGELMTWNEALRFCENLMFAGYDDWRLPNINELFSLADFGKDYPDPSMNSVFGFPEEGRAIETWRYWSSTPKLAGFSYAVWFFGGVTVDPAAWQDRLRVRAVRGGI